MNSRVLRFLISGGSAAIAEYLVFFLLQQTLSIEWILFSQSLSFACGFLISYLLNRTWVFKSTNGSGREFAKYSALAMLNLIISNIVITGLTGPVEMNQYAAKILVMFFIAIWNYFVMSNIIFKNWQRKA